MVGELQGSVFGHLLFILYVAQIGNVVSPLCGQLYIVMEHPNQDAVIDNLQ